MRIIARERFYGVAVMSAFALVAVYVAWSALIGLAAFAGAVRTSAPVVVAYSGDVIVLPGATVVMLFAVLEIARPPERWRRLLIALALGFAIVMLLLPIGFRLGIGPFLSERGYTRCPGRVVGYTLPAVRFVRDRHRCSAGV